MALIGLTTKVSHVYKFGVEAWLLGTQTHQCN